MFVRDKTIKNDIDALLSLGENAKLQVHELVRVQELQVRQKARESNLIDQLMKSKIRKHQERISALISQFEKDLLDKECVKLKAIVNNMISRKNALKDEALDLLSAVNGMNSGINRTDLLLEGISDRLEASEKLLLDASMIVDKFQEQSVSLGNAKDMLKELVDQANLIALNTEIGTVKQDCSSEVIDLKHLSQESKELADKYVDISQATINSLSALNEGFSEINNGLIGVEKGLEEVDEKQKAATLILDSLKESSETASSIVSNLCVSLNTASEDTSEDTSESKQNDPVTSYDYADTEFIQGDFDLNALSDVHRFFIANELYQSWIQKLVEQHSFECNTEFDVSSPVQCLYILNANFLNLHSCVSKEVNESQDLIYQLLDKDNCDFTKLADRLAAHAKEINKLVVLGLITLTD
ncbi:hypothetical protein NDJ00_11345 [Vibrio parahaemolyticus]|uniref:hypothetical protein n=1 Tax=Vibrio parahaemolyticus TaxID=670 RepID=UPI0006C2C9FB|nr:hypothetical protein [Vibrio parahaemolyticus]EGR5927995.1 hypothetical protein [Vibrio parahaemolyticus]KOY37957.1 hypothetical protein ACX10_11970 [Vibrio parahaemolyticus]MCS0114763.1 hypothetical protein [Vibrio parahaemolyticus]